MRAERHHPSIDGAHSRDQRLMTGRWAPGLVEVESLGILGPQMVDAFIWEPMDEDAAEIFKAARAAERLVKADEASEP